MIVIQWSNTLISHVRRAAYTTNCICPISTHTLIARLGLMCTSFFFFSIIKTFHLRFALYLVPCELVFVHYLICINGDVFTSEYNGRCHYFSIQLTVMKKRRVVVVTLVFAFNAYNPAHNQLPLMHIEMSWCYYSVRLSLCFHVALWRHTKETFIWIDAFVAIKSSLHFIRFRAKLRHPIAHFTCYFKPHFCTSCFVCFVSSLEDWHETCWPHDV